MKNFLHHRGLSMTMVMLVLLIITLMEASISYTTTFGGLDRIVPSINDGRIIAGWIALRGLLIILAIGLWFLNRQRALFKVIIVTNSLLTLGLIANTVALMLELVSGISLQTVNLLLADVFF